jgi:phosphate starvation-inducible PhoH-like protein
MTSKIHTDDVYNQKKILKSPIKFKISLDEPQKEVIEFIKRYKMSLILADPGCGKTTISMYHALSELRKKNKEKILITKPIVEIGTSIGYLPGPQAEKIASYMESYETIIDKIVGIPEKEKLFREEKIIFKPIQYVRGNNFEDAIIIFDEAQGCSLHEIISFVTRVSDSSDLIVLADPYQSDIKKSGIFDFIKIVNKIDEIGVRHLDESFQKRSALVQKLYKEYKNYIS